MEQIIRLIHEVHEIIFTMPLLLPFSHISYMQGHLALS
jgi:hypothetical protein